MQSNYFILSMFPSSSSTKSQKERNQKVHKQTILLKIRGDKAEQIRAFAIEFLMHSLITGLPVQFTFLGSKNDKIQEQSHKILLEIVERGNRKYIQQPGSTFICF